MVEILDIERAELARLGPDVFRRLEQGSIFYVRGSDEVRALTDHIAGVLARRVSQACGHDARAFFGGGHTPPYESLLQLILVLREIRDSRYLSCLFSDLIAGLGLPPPVLIDTGYFRCVFPKAFAALHDDARVPRDVYEGLPIDPEPFLKDTNRGGGPHRDVDVPHYTFQINFWFPLHDVPAENSLLLFPDIYTRDIAYQQKPEPLREPDRWGYGQALRRPLRLGDFVLFHSQHFHASPTEAPDSDRLTAELRVASACIDDNSAVYRRLFWSARNFEPLAAAAPSERATRLHPLGSAVPDAPLSAQELLAALFDRPEDVRHGGNLWTPESVFATSRRLSREALVHLIERLNAAAFADDRQLALARYLLFWGERDLGERVLTDAVQRTESYYFALEQARVAGAAQLWALAGQALIRAFALAQSSPVAIGRYRGDVPARPLPRLQFMPEDAMRAAGSLGAALRDYLAAPQSRPAPLLDYRLFFPFLIQAQPLLPSGIVVSVWTILVFVPLQRAAEIGLRLVEDAGGRRIEGAFNPDPVVRDPRGIVTAYSLTELGSRLRRAYPVTA